MPSPDILAEIPRLRRYARALTGDRDRADDLVQDTLERALGRWRLWRGGNTRSWLLTIMHNIFVNQVRAPHAVDFMPDEELPLIPVRDHLADALAVRDLDRQLAALPPEQRAVLLLVGLEELSYGEAARVLGIPAGTVMSRLARARARLRELLERQERGERIKVVK